MLYLIALIIIQQCLYQIKFYINQVMMQPRDKVFKVKKRVHSEPKSPYEYVQAELNKHNSYIDSSNVTDSLKSIQEQVSDMLRRRHSIIRKTNVSRRETLLNKKNSVTLEISSIKADLNALKEKVLHYQRQTDLNQRLDKILNQNNNSVQKPKPKLHLPAIVPSYNHYPMYPPYAPTVPLNYNPYSYPPPQRIPKYPSRHSQLYSDQTQIQYSQPKELKQIKRKQLRERKRTKQIQKVQKKRSKKTLINILKKIFRVVAFTVIFKNLIYKIINKRKRVFNSFWPQMFHKSTNRIRKWFSNNCKQFFNQMQDKSGTSIRIQGDQSAIIINTKKKAIKALLRIFIQCLENSIEDKAFQQVSEVLHIFCKHGSNIGDGILTPEQIEIVCISDVFGYLRMDKSLQKSQIISFLFMKIIVFNMLLQPWKYDEQKFNIRQHKQAYQNFYYFSSIVYQLLMEIQDKLLDSSHSQTIQIGNWRAVKSKFRIKCSPSLCHLECNHEEQEFISGLVGQKVLKEIFPMSFWREQIIKLETIIQKMHTKIRKVHAKFINSIYNYKDMHNFI